MFLFSSAVKLAGTEAYLHGLHEFVTEGVENGAALLQPELPGILTEVFCHRVADRLQFLKIGLYFCQAELSFLIKAKTLEPVCYQQNLS